MNWKDPAKAARAMLLGASTMLVIASGAVGQDYPNKSITLVVPSAPGGGASFVAQLLATEMEKDLGQSVIIDNQPGGGTVIGTEAVHKAAPDGYTILLTTTSFAVNEALVANLPYNAATDFSPISFAVDTPLALIVNAEIGIDTVADLVARAKENPGSVTYGSAGLGSAHHLLAVNLASTAGIEMRHVPYQGGGPAATAVASGEVNIAFVDAGVVQELIAGGLVKALAISAPERLRILPDVPTMEEAGVPGSNLSTWQGIVGPDGMPPEVVARLNRAVHAALSTPSVIEALESSGKTARPTTPEEYGAFLEEDIARWKILAEAAGIQPQ